MSCFSFNLLNPSTENLTNVFGEKLRNQVEDRLKFYETGNIPRKNVEVMSEALEEHNQLITTLAKKAKKRKLEEVNGKSSVLWHVHNILTK